MGDDTQTSGPKNPGAPDMEVEDCDEKFGLVPKQLYLTDGQLATNIKIVFTKNDLISEYPQRSFHPAMVHQVFEDGIIYGYRNLNIDLYYLANSANCFVDIRHTKVLDQDSSEHAPPDDIFKNLSPWLPEGYYTDQTKFLKAIKVENHYKTYGVPISTIKLYNAKEKNTYKYEFTLCSTDEPGFAEFHSNFQCMIVWFIDGASQIDVEDPNWMYIYVYEKRKSRTSEKRRMYPVGFATVYKFFHFPDKVRTRISQFFIIPPCQGMGLGSHLLKNTYKVLGQLPNIIDITVEDPCPAFTRMRDFIDCQLLMQLESFKDPSIKKGYSNSMFIEANAQYKINKQQCRHVYEILRFSCIKYADLATDYCEAFDEICDRLTVPYVKDNGPVEKVQPIADDDLVSYLSNSRRFEQPVEESVSRYVRDIMKIAERFKRKIENQHLNL